MAELFLAQEPPGPELVVLKRILPYLSEEPEFVQMFLDEARIAAQLHHPNIVQVYELGKLDNTIFIAMEFVEGIDLRRVVQEEAKFGANVPFGVAAAICAQVAAGLDYAHHSRAVDGRPLELIHRDVSPQNVMIAYDGRVKLVDFGIAKAGAFIEARSKPGVIKGKFLYLSPEQVAQEKLDHRADIFALGTMMYEITTGKSPFAKPTTEGILYAIRSEDPSPPHLLRDDYPTELSRIIMRCLVKDRNLRYQRASEVQADLEAFLESGVLKQSTDIPDYIARLMGEEEERTVLHIPVAVPAARKDATVPMSAGRGVPVMAAQAALTARPVRPPTGEEEIAPEYGAEPEPPTQMARPGELLAREPEAAEEADLAYGEDEPEPRREEEDDDAEESTAIGTFPMGFTPPSSGDLTVSQRAPQPPRGRSTPAQVPTSGAPRRSSNPALERDTEPRGRRPLPPSSRRPFEEEDEELSHSVSLTQPTLNERPRRVDDEASQSVSVTPPSTGQRRRLDDDEDFESAPVTSPATGQRRRVDDEASLASATIPQRGSRQLARHQPPDEDSLVQTEAGFVDADDTDSTAAYVADPEDDESTAGYENEPETPKRRGRGLLLALAAIGLLMLLGGGLFWALNFMSEATPGASFGPPPAQPLQIPTPGEATEANAETPDTAPPEGTEAVAVANGEQPSSLEPGAAGSPAPATGEEAGEPPGGATDLPGNAAPGRGTALASTTGAVAAVGTQDSTPGNTAAGAETSPTTSTGAPVNTDQKVVPTGVAVKFMTRSPTAVIWVNGNKIEANKVLSLPPGTLRVKYECSSHKRATKGSFVKPLKEGEKKPIEFAIPCKKGQK
jgi:eukaryotic-like serine/threonine-protein kinase